MLAGRQTTILIYKVAVVRTPSGELFAFSRETEQLVAPILTRVGENK
jgi:hypothetical protein